ncbi:MAG: hypothetical protein OXK78_02630 [Caldilineaceae bacterium]|nr:hypothetical protein [Caldilineaceae bacterium]
MNILNIERDIEESLANLATTALPAVLEGLRHLPVSDRNPQVSIRYQHNSRKVRADADASYFDPESCEVVIRFETPMNDGRHENSALDPDALADAFDFEAAVGQLLIELEKAESTRPFVGLKWFRDHILSECDHDWSHDSRTRHLLLRHATDQHLVLTSQVPNPNEPHHPVTAIRVNRRHPRFQTGDPGRANDFTPVRIKGGLISDTVLGGRR